MASNTRQQQELHNLLLRYNKRLGELYGKFLRELSALGIDMEEELTEDTLFHFDEFPELKERLEQIVREYKADLLGLMKRGIGSGVALAFSQDERNLRGYTVLNDKAIRRVRENAMQGFLRERLHTAHGLNLSQKVWNYAEQGRSEFEMALSNVLTEGLRRGTSAAELSHLVREQLNEPDMMYRRYHHKVLDVGGTKRDVVKWHKKVVDDEGKVHFVTAPLEEVGQGVYRSSYKNTFRLMRTEINSSYHYANYERWQHEPFVIGQRIWLSPQHPCEDICDDLAGDYPKDFKWAGWHPQCYSDDTEVYTSRGWLLFADVREDDYILSLNPETRNVEWTGITQMVKYKHKGDMVRFHNRSLDMLVTPDHKMIYLNKADGRITSRLAADYSKGNGGLYRSCEYLVTDSYGNFQLGETIVPLTDFAEFMGYWLSDGNVSRKYSVFIAQQEGDPNRENIVDCIKRLGFEPRLAHNGIYIFDKDLWEYLQPFGKCNTKYIPKEIKNGSKADIRAFLDAYISCDGHIKKPRSFVGSHGNICNPTRGERMYYTTSKRLADDIGECILKVGHRPSFNLVPSKGEKQQFKNGEYTLNFDLWRISECYSQTATVFNKTIEPYDGYVYDLELDTNHIMYVRRNGKCVWGSNCMCASAAILCDKKEMDEIEDHLVRGEDLSNYESPNRVKDVPQQFKDYVKRNQDKLLAAKERGKLGYVWRDNEKYVKLGEQRSGEQLHKPTPLEIAKERPAKRTQAQIDDIHKRWDRRKVHNIMRECGSKHLASNSIAVKEVRLANKLLNEGGSREQIALHLDNAKRMIQVRDNAVLRHASRTPAQITNIQRRWDEKRYLDLQNKWTNSNIAWKNPVTKDIISIQSLIGKLPHEEIALKLNSLNHRVDIIAAANLRHQSRTPQQIASIMSRWQARNLARSTSAYDSIISRAQGLGIEYVPVGTLDAKLTTESSIIQRLAGADKTKGSCSSLAFAYAGNKAGLDVLDFRGGASCQFFARNSNIQEIVKGAGGLITKHFNDIKNARGLFATMQEGHEYYFSIGRHAAIIRKNSLGIEYLEMQSGRRENKFYMLTDMELRRRFSATMSHTSHGYKYKAVACLVDIDDLVRDSGYRRLMGYINTTPGKQRKGLGGGEK